MADEPAHEPLHARFRGTRWPGLIWAVPVAAALIVGWLGIDAFSKRGPEVTVEFPTTGGIKPGNTVVKFRGVEVGHVTAVHLGKSLATMNVRLRLNGDMAGHLGRGTRFWIAGQNVSFTNLASLKTIVSGPYIAVAPENGPTVDHFTGLTRAPTVNPDRKGITVTITAARKGNLASGAGVFYNQFRIGTVRHIAMDKDGAHFTIHAFIQDRYAHLITTRSRFWNAGGVQMKTGGNGPRLSLQSIPALVSGALGVETPEGGVPAGSNTHFRLYPSETAARDAPGPHAVSYRAVLAGGPGGLEVGAPVMLEGVKAGAVTKIAMSFDPKAGRLETQVRFALDPSEIPLAGPAHWNLKSPRPQMDSMLSALIDEGLRARISRATPLIGQQQLALAMIKGATPATLGTGTIPTIPATPGSSVSHIMDTVSDVLANLHDASQQLAALSQAPQTKKMLQNLANSTAEIAEITRTTRGELPHLLADLRRTTNEADAALRAAHGLLASEGGAANAPESQTLPHTLYELSRAARALRELTDYLTAHPNALILGKER